MEYKKLEGGLFSDMENKTIEDTTVSETYQIKEPPTLWKWYFGWRPQILFRVPIFLLFVYQGIWFILGEIQDVIFFFQHTPITWWSILLVMFFGSILVWFILAPIFICFMSIDWLYQINIGKNTAWRKFLYSIGIILLVLFGTSIIRLFTAWILGILRI